MASFEELKAQYQSVITTIQSQGVRVANLHHQDGKLVIKGMAPTLEAANAVWDEIKRVNPRMDDIIADFPVDSSKAATPTAGPARAQGGQTPQMYTVKPGDTLSKISKQFYGNPNDYMKIFNANRDKLKDPDQISIGQELKIPPAA